jgi:hypothetical protein
METNPARLTSKTPFTHTPTARSAVPPPKGCRMRRFVLFVAPVLTVLLLTDARPAAAIAPTPADLGMARLADLEIDNTSDARALLRFSATIVNIGSGPFELSASRSSSSGTFSVTQRVYNSDGSSSEHPVPVEMVFGGDGHDLGWGDIYRSTLPDQYIEVTGLADGKYRLRAVADESNWFTESNEVISTRSA